MTEQRTPFPAASLLGYPRIGRRRELKKAVEAYWAGKIDAAALEAAALDIQLGTAKRLQELGLTEAAAVPGTFSFYDQVLDTTAHLGAVPARFGQLLNGEGKLDLDGYFTLARGNDEQQPLEMTKWFDTNYHYLVPEIGPETDFTLASTRKVDEFAAALANGVETRPYIVGPVTYLLLSKASDDAPAGFEPLSRLEDILPVYVELLARLAEAGAGWVQLDEPALVVDQETPAARIEAAVARAYEVLTSAANRPQILVSSPYGALDGQLGTLAATNIDALHLDLFKGEVPSAAALAALGTKTLVAGLVDGHNIWRNDLAASAAKLDALKAAAGRVTVSTSTSTQHVPHDVAEETQLPEQLRSWLAFSDQKAVEVRTLADYLADPASAQAAIDQASAVIASRATAEGVRREDVRTRTGALTAADFSRSAYEVREAAQTEALALPPLPTTTIGSFPQTSEIRSARARNNKGDLTDEQYQQLMKDEIKRVVELQEELGYDVLVHGEPERNDMVQYFAENLEGFDVTVHGWVQSYGSRCTRPSILWGDVTRSAPITVAWAEYAQSLTSKPMKGMLTGPVTILAWSFVRDDQPLGETANQVGLALRDEIADLEAAGIRIIQVDEPALRELLPLRKAEHADYLKWSVDSFRLATAGAKDETQIHTHLCYSEFGVIIDAIDGLDADVTSIEAARSRMEVVHDLESHGFGRGVGPGVYDIHSPRVPGEAEVTELLATAVKHVPSRQLWVNPDCGLKTRGYVETEESLRNLVKATQAVRAELLAAAK
ncbi:5-methyltetrahydropteroyltriglutamate--homocysteine S-methyltransferase [Pseudarthrobacter sp. J75]|uniref:5-methyltetrahydropteroyltriglutamate-- homocysteine S-methyltransferase n=1 Tax=unclassified Pseudarthrobacter TaxID=2647000 RepID=UPI002E81F7D6|nr:MULTISPECIES: 5-methyltetrahydropteroyltriglutamate--homocysteine S-methyltransferase [unclassified Pseudarthrobacter]MEE2523440.1 5-methyltetrahydropteroyltriglutamate--homocysteine S-methyltransferase [Pseudarthrobacter sp. J47]MEE2529405.1 5-methyltetrahydropteroyltriglutamate--homocysteine S-methyltransferase [Pseudarthrobacter sp. J75]